MCRSIGFLTLLLAACVACTTSRPAPPFICEPISMITPPGPPVARTEVVVENIHGIEVRDPYRWMEKGGPEMETWLAAGEFALRGEPRFHLRPALLHPAIGIAHFDAMDVLDHDLGPRDRRPRRRNHRDRLAYERGCWPRGRARDARGEKQRQETDRSTHP